jgi:hypothetical protein
MSKRRTVKQTLLLVGEGEAEKAFFRHLINIYSPKHIEITPQAAYGCKAKVILNEAKRYGTLAKYDRKCVLLDTDQGWPQRAKSLAPGFSIFGTKPCLEGMLLSILGKNVQLTGKCPKEDMKPYLEGRDTDPLSYGKFTKVLLDSKRTQVKLQDANG